jgi:hypothetical protein
MSEREPFTSPEMEENRNDLTPEKAHHLLFRSFRFSQGDIELQHEIFKWIHENYPGYVFNAEVRDKASELLLESAGRFLSAGRKNGEQVLHNQDLSIGLNEQVTEQVDSMYRAFNPEEFQDEDEFDNDRPTIETIANSVLAKDYEYLIVKHGRPRSEKIGQGLDSDPYLSHICKYGFEHHGTGMEEYNKMFSEIITYIRNCLNDGTDDPGQVTMLKMLNYVIKEYESTHSDVMVPLSLEERERIEVYE